MRPCALLDEWIAFTGQLHLVERRLNETHADRHYSAPCRWAAVTPWSWATLCLPQRRVQHPHSE